MLKLGEVVFAAFDYARKSCGLTAVSIQPLFWWYVI